MTITTHPILYIGIWLISMALIALLIDKLIMKNKHKTVNAVLLFLLVVVTMEWWAR